MRSQRLAAARKIHRDLYVYLRHVPPSHEFELLAGLLFVGAEVRLLYDDLRLRVDVSRRQGLCHTGCHQKGLALLAVQIFIWGAALW